MDDKQLTDWFEEFVRGASHTRTFLTTKNKMHADGVALWDESVATAKDILSNLRERARDWQPMDTAPKDGRQIIVLYPLHNPDEYKAMLVFWKTVGWDTGTWMLHSEPHGWCPLPEVPPFQERGL